MDEFDDMHWLHGPHGPGWGWGPGAFGLLLPALLTALWLIPLALLLWSTRHVFLGRRSDDPPAPTAETVSAVEQLRQQYVRGEIDVTTYGDRLAHMLAELAARANSPTYSRVPGASDTAETSAATTDEPDEQDEQTYPPFRFRADIPVDWS